MFTVYTKENCPLCEATKNFLNKQNIQFQEFIIGKDISREDVLTKFPGVTMAPVIITENGSQLPNTIITSWINQEKHKRSINHD